VLRIRALARRKPAAQPRILRAAGIELDPLHRAVTHNGRPLDISAKEFAVLETLLRAAPGVLSAEDLLAQAWDENADPFTKTVQVTLSRLRRKLGDPRSSRPSPASATGSQTQITSPARCLGEPEARWSRQWARPSSPARTPAWKREPASSAAISSATRRR
jgi:hypothetical protein